MFVILSGAKNQTAASRRRKGKRASMGWGREQGIALVVSLLLLSLMSVLGIVMMVSVNSDTLINGYYGNYRGSFYAADSGVNIARQQLLNQVQAAVNMTPCTGWETNAATGCTSAPLASFSAGSALTSLQSTYGSFTSLNSGQAASSWHGNFQIANYGNCTNSFAQAGAPTTTQNSQGQNSSYVYNFKYTLCAVGQAQGLQKVNTSENGNLSISIQAQTSTTRQVVTSFAAFGMFINNYSPCSAALVPGTISGPTFTNGSWQFGTSGNYIFTDPVGQANSQLGYWFGSTCISSANPSYSSGGQTIKPTFQQGVNLGQPVANQPANDYSQKWAVLDGQGCGEGSNVCGNLNSPSPPAVTNANLNSSLKNISGTAYPTGGTTSGVYLPYSCNQGTCTFNGGGVYVEGGASVSLSTGTGTEVYTITQGSTTTTVTTNVGANTTTVKSGSTTLNIVGVPHTAGGQASTMLYVDGTISSLSGPGQGVPAIQDGTQITITANGNVDITGDLIYNHEPVTLNTSDALIPGNDYNQVLGIFTVGGNVVASSPYSNGNLEIDASLAAIGSNCGTSNCGLTTASHINTLNIVGGRIQSNILGIDVDTRNIYFDRRFTSKNGFAPPYFPATSLPQVNITNALTPLVTPLQAQRMSWTTSPQ